MCLRCNVVVVVVVVVIVICILVGLNHYTSKYVQNKPLPAISTSYDDDQGTVVTNIGIDGQLIGAQAASPWYYYTI